MIMKTYIYALTAEVGIDTILPGIFYIGRTVDISRRESQHRVAAKNPVNTEHKYQHIRALTALGHDFKLEVIAELDNFDEFSERYFIHQAILGGAKLTNMKPGDAGIYARISPTVTLHNFKAAWLAAVAEDLAAREEEARRVSAALNATIREQLYHPAVTTWPPKRGYRVSARALNNFTDDGEHRVLFDQYNSAADDFIEDELGTTFSEVYDHPAYRHLSTSARAQLLGQIHLISKTPRIIFPNT